MMTHYPVIIIGSGPAGLTAALYAGRAKLNPLVLEGQQPGGLLTTTTKVENYPGFPHGVQGPELTAMMRRQAEQYGADCRFETVTQVDLNRRPFRITSDKAQYTADKLIIATGASPKTLGLAGERELTGRGVSTCATCDGPLYQGKTVAVVGAGDAAMEEAHFLSRFAKKVTVFVRGAGLRASQIMQDRVRSTPNIDIRPETSVTALHSSHGDFSDNAAPVSLKSEAVLDAITVRNNRTGSTERLPVDALFVAIGQSPNTGFLRGKVAMDKDGVIQVEPGSTATSVAGVHAAGDVQDKTFRQAITAAASGCMAALSVARDLSHAQANAKESPRESRVSFSGASPRLGLGEIKTLTAASFDESLAKSKSPVLVDFWAPWCPPCRRLAPILDELAKAYSGRVTIAKVNVDEQPDLAARFRVRSLPTLMLFEPGKPQQPPVASTVGAPAEAELRTWLDGYLKAKAVQVPNTL